MEYKIPRFDRHRHLQRTLNQRRNWTGKYPMPMYCLGYDWQRIPGQYSNVMNVLVFWKKNCVIIDCNKIHVQTNTESVQCLPVKYHRSNESWCLDIKTGLHSNFILTRIRSVECGTVSVPLLQLHLTVVTVTWPLPCSLPEIFFSGHVSTFLGAYLPN